MDRTDQDLIAAYFQGETEAFDILVKRHLPALYTFIRRYSPEQNMVDDIVQETFVKVWRNLKKFDTSKNFRTWLFTIGRMTMIDWFRKKKSVAFSVLDTEERNFSDTLIDEKESAAETFDMALQVTALIDVSKQLSPPDRVILTLYFQENLTFQEIAEVLDQSINTVKSRHRRALSKLKKNIHAPK